MRAVGEHAYFRKVGVSGSSGMDEGKNSHRLGN